MTDEIPDEGGSASNRPEPEMEQSGSADSSVKDSSKGSPESAQTNTGSANTGGGFDLHSLIRKYGKMMIFFAVLGCVVLFLGSCMISCTFQSALQGL